MTYARRLAGAIFLGGLALCLTGLAVAEDAPAADPLAQPHAFDDGITALRTALVAGDCKQAVEDFKALLVAHKGKNYAKARRVEIEELMRELACAARHPRPKPQDLLSGKLKKWDAAKGKIQITYTPKTSADLGKRGDMLYLPARLVGPFTLEIKGSKYAPDPKDLPLVMLGGDEHPESGKEQSWKVVFGPPLKVSARGAKKVEVQIIYLDGEDAKTA